MTRRKPDPAELLRQALAALDQPAEPANDDESIDEDAIRERMHRVVERVKRARNQR